MKAKVKSAELGKALKLCVSAIEPKDQIRSNIEFEADVDNSLLLLKATNNQYSISVVCSAEVSDDVVHQFRENLLVSLAVGVGKGANHFNEFFHIDGFG